MLYSNNFHGYSHFHIDQTIDTDYTQATKRVITTQRISPSSQTQKTLFLRLNGGKMAHDVIILAKLCFFYFHQDKFHFIPGNR